MEVGGWKITTFFILIAASCVLLALFSAQSPDFLASDASPMPPKALHVIRQWESEQGDRAENTTGIFHTDDKESTIDSQIRDLGSPLTTEMTSSPTRELVSSPTCYRQVQVWSGSSNPQKPREFDCPHLECGIRFVQDTSFTTMQSSDAVVLFHRTKWDWDKMMKKRPLGQMWSFYTLESALHTKKNAFPPERYRFAYNYTISYKPSSTIYGPYGIYDTTTSQITPSVERNWAQEKTRMIVWMASNCGISGWNRYGFVKKLAQHIKVDIYGGCGPLKCSRDTETCWKTISSYRYYLAVENSECRDYITEKFWMNSLEHDVVPIVYGAPKNDYLQVAPPNSFIHLEDFKSIDDLTQYLHVLNANDTLYNSFFEWKRHGIVRRVAKKIILSAPYLCKVVEKLLTDEKDLSTGKIKEGEIVVDVNRWFKPTCLRKTGFPHTF